MPVDKNRYPSSWRKVSLTIRRLAGWRCEWCQIENGAPLPSGRAGRVVLTVAHLGTPYADGRPGDKHDKHDIRRENLAALCARCHLKFDLDEHIQHAKETRARKKRERACASGQLSLFAQPEEVATLMDERSRAKRDMAGNRKVKPAPINPPVESLAGLAGLFPADRRKKYIGQKTSLYDSILEGDGMLPLLSHVRGFYGHCSASVCSCSADKKM